MDRINETINHDIVYSTCTVWYVRENRRDNQEWTIHKNCQHWAHKTQDEHEHSKQHNTICVGYHYTKTNTNNVSKAWIDLRWPFSTCAHIFYNIFMNASMRQLIMTWSTLHVTCGMIGDNAILIFASDKMKHFKVYQWLIGH
jgi:hypothetical protein